MWLQIEREIANLIEKERATMGGSDKTDTVAICTGECTLHETEEFRANERCRNGTAIQRDKRSLHPRAMTVDSPSDKFLPGSGFSLDQNRQIGSRDLVHGLQDARHSGVGSTYSVGSAVSMFQSLRAALRLAHRHRGSQSWGRQCADFIQQLSLLFRKTIGDLAILQIDKRERFISGHQRRAQNRSK
jgi:hypothetical protein